MAGGDYQAVEMSGPSVSHNNHTTACAVPHVALSSPKIIPFRDTSITVVL